MNATQTALLLSEIAVGVALTLMSATYIGLYFLRRKVRKDRHERESRTVRGTLSQHHI
jgi:hypothetical protein